MISSSSAKGLKSIRIALASLMLLCIASYFCDPTGVLRHYLGWTVDVQLIPSLLSGFVIAAILIAVLTLLFGRVYCSVICPLGVSQDVVRWIYNKVSRKRGKAAPRSEKLVMRLIFFVLFFGTIFVSAFPIARLLEPYSIFGRVMTAVMAPAVRAVQSALAAWSVSADNFLFAEPPMLNSSYVMLGVALVSVAVIVPMAAMRGRLYCNSVCPVGTLLGAVSEYAAFRPIILSEKCVHCGQCARACKAEAIDVKAMRVDMSRCVSCFDCVSGVCSKDAIVYASRGDAAVEDGLRGGDGSVFGDRLVSRVRGLFASKKVDEKVDTVDEGKRAFLTVAALAAGAAASKSMAAKTVDGGFAEILPKEPARRESRIVPPGAASYANLDDHCTGCGLCVTACPNGVLRPSADLMHLMAPEMGFESGYCRPECVRCSEVCPTDAINLIDRARKSSVHVGHAVLNTEACISIREGVSCGNCARHCPVGAITMIPTVAGDEASPKMPNVNSERCIGCGACEYLCPVRPLSAIFVEGHSVHRED